jgi:hypothetical protein
MAWVGAVRDRWVDAWRASDRTPAGGTGFPEPCWPQHCRMRSSGPPPIGRDLDTRTDGEQKSLLATPRSARLVTMSRIAFLLFASGSSWPSTMM